MRSIPLLLYPFRKMPRAVDVLFESRCTECSGRSGAVCVCGLRACVACRCLPAVASLLPYLGVFMKQLGLSPAESAVIYGLMPFIGAVVRALLGALVDKFRCPKVTFAVCCLLSAALHACLLLLGSGLSPQPGAGTAVCHRDVFYLSDCRPAAGRGSDDVTRGRLANLASSQTCFHVTTAGGQCAEACDSGSGQKRCSLTGQNCTFFTGHFGDIPADAVFEGRFQLFANVTGVVATDCRVHRTSSRAGRRVNASCSSPSGESDQLTCVGPVSATTADAAAAPDRRASQRFGRQFWTFIAIFLPAQIAFAPVFSLLDAITYALLGERRHAWGRQRMWGSVGYGSLAIVSGLLVDAASSGRARVDYTPAVLLFAFFQAATAAIIACFPRQNANRKREDDSLVQRRHILRDLFQLIRIPHVLPLLVLVFMFGAYTGHIETFLFWYLQTLQPDRPPPQLLFGLCIAANSLPEMIVLFVAEPIIKRIGHVRCLYIACVSFATRFIYYSLIQNPWLVLLAEPLQATAFGLMYAAASSYASEVTPSGMHGTVQGVIGSIYFGFGKRTSAIRISIIVDMSYFRGSVSECMPMQCSVCR